MKRFKYQPNGSSATGNNPALPSYMVELGKDAGGREWLCKVSPTGTSRHLMWNVDFDTNEEYMVKADPSWDVGSEELSSPFLRPEVVYGDINKWDEMNRERYHRKTVEYKDIGKTIAGFVNGHSIE